MKKKMLSIIICTMIICFTISLPTNASPDSSKKPCDTMSKVEFAAYVDSMPAMYSNRQYSYEEIAAALSEYILDGFSEDEKNNLEQMGIYLYSYATDTEEESIQPMAVGTTDQVDQETPAVSYNSNTREWTVVAGGKWNDISWVPNTKGSIGGYERVGFIFRNSNIASLSASKRPEYTSVIGSLVSPTAGSSYNVINYDACTADDTKGVACELQDKSLLNTSKTYGHYIGQNYAIVVTYDSKFANVTGSIKGYYIHTGTSCNIKEVSYNGSSSGNLEVNATFSVDSAGFREYSRNLAL